MQLHLTIDPAGGMLSGRCAFQGDELSARCFLLNPELAIDRVSSGGQAVDCAGETVRLRNRLIRKVALPAGITSLEIDYHGRLSGESGFFPYVRERITPEFSLIRWETFCYPIPAAEDWDALFAQIRKRGAASFCVEAPASHTVVGSEPLMEVQAHGDFRRYRFSSPCASYSNFSCACARYRQAQLPMGLFYLRDGHADLARVNQVLAEARDYLTRHYGARELSSPPRFVAVPEGLGSFVCPDTQVVFLQESALDSARGMSQIIHEYIHLGWNARADDSVQRSRFFDEAFTCFFELKVMAHLLGNDEWERRYWRQWGEQMAGGAYQLVPICRFGGYGYGDLSYTIGALMLKNLCDLLGEAEFDAKTRDFLTEFREKPATFSDFIRAYQGGSDAENRVKAFFDQWFFGCKGYQNRLSPTIFGEIRG